jgi:hypothetical protein
MEPRDPALLGGHATTGRQSRRCEGAYAIPFLRSVWGNGC